MVKRGWEFVGCTVLPMGLAICAFWAIVFAWLPAGRLPGGRFPGTVFGTLIGTMLAAFATLAIQNARALRRLARARRGETPRDGEPATFVGVLEGRTERVLAAPFSGRPALAYRYQVSRPVRGREGHSRSAVAFQGESAVPSVVRTEGGMVSLLGRPAFVQGFERIEGEGARRKARAFLEARFPESKAAEARTSEVPKPAAAAGRPVEEEGAFEEHSRSVAGHGLPRPLDPSTWDLLEAVFAPGERACVSGVWSAERGGLAAPNWGTEGLLVEHGDLANAASRRWTMLAKTGFVALFFLVFQVVFVWVVWREIR